MTKDVLVLAAERIRQGGKKRRVKETGAERRMNGVGGGGGGAAGVKLSQKVGRVAIESGWVISRYTTGPSATWAQTQAMLCYCGSFRQVSND
jgi:hypothetical protein